MHVQVSWEAIEEAFWSIVEEGEEDVEVLYGADLDSTIFGSAFPTRSGRMSESEYTDAPWNLNNIPRLPGTPSAVMRHHASPPQHWSGTVLAGQKTSTHQSGQALGLLPGHPCSRCSTVE